MTRALDARIPVDVIYLDFARAFSMVPRRRLFNKLEHFHVRGEVLGWIDAFLSGRSFRVRVGCSLSTPRQVRSGVP